MSVFPYIRTPLSDFTGRFMIYQESSSCADLELKVVNCLEAYGEKRAKVKCADIIEDLHECSTKYKQNMRVYEMRKERSRQIRSGEISKEDADLKSAKIDSFKP